MYTLKISFHTVPSAKMKLKDKFRLHMKVVKQEIVSILVLVSFIGQELRRLLLLNDYLHLTSNVVRYAIMQKRELLI